MAEHRLSALSTRLHEHGLLASEPLPAHGGEDLVRLVPGIDRIARLRIEDWARMPWTGRAGAAPVATLDSRG